MNKTIFEIGLLAFCIAVVVFGMQGLPIMEIVTRAFIVLVAVVVGGALLVTALLVMAEKAKPAEPVAAGEGAQTRRETGKVQSPTNA